MKILNIPPGTVINKIGTRVSLDFFLEADADLFIEFLLYLDNPENAGKELKVERPPEERTN